MNITPLISFKNSAVSPSLMRSWKSVWFASFSNTGPLFWLLFSPGFWFHMYNFLLALWCLQKDYFIFCQTFLVVRRGKVGRKQPNLPLAEAKVCSDHF